MTVALWRGRTFFGFRVAPFLDADKVSPLDNGRDLTYLANQSHWLHVATLSKLVYCCVG